MRVYDIGGRDEPPRRPRDRIWTVANCCRSRRLAALPVIYLDLVGERWLRAFVLLVVFSATDWFDGYLARRLDQMTKLGKLLDPISDRLLFVVVGVGFVVAGLLPLWAVLVAARPRRRSCSAPGWCCCRQGRAGRPTSPGSARPPPSG